MNFPHLAPAAAARQSQPDAAAAVRRNLDIVARIRDSDVYRAYEDAFQASIGLPLVLQPAGDPPAPLDGTRNLNRFCVLMAARNPGCASCLRRSKVVELAAGASTYTGRCPAGLCESAVPIRVGGETVAFLKTGQVALRRLEPSGFLRARKRFHAQGEEMEDSSELKRAYLATRVVTQGQYGSLLRLLSLFAEHLSSLTHRLAAQQADAESPVVAKARAFLAAHQAEEISLTDVARAVNMSSCYFCKTFRKATGTTFVDYLAKLRVESVKTLLLNPHKRISEAAFEAGFQSLSQFNRVFRRVAGQAPTAYRAGLGAPVPPRLSPAA